MALATPGPIETFVNAAARDATIVKPVIGQGVFLIDSGSLLFYYGPYLGWLPPWNRAWGEQVTTLDATLGAGLGINAPTETELIGLRTNLTAVAGRKYRMVVSMVAWNSNAAAPGTDPMTLRVRDGFNGTVIGQAYTITLDRLANEEYITFTVETSTLLGGPHVLTVTCQTTGSGAILADFGNWPLELRVDDIGPAANPIYR